MRIRLPKIPLLLIVSLWLPVVAHAVVGRLVEGDLRLDKGDTWEWPGSEAPVAGMELRGKLLGGERDRVGGWDMALRGLQGDTIAVITVEWDARTSWEIMLMARLPWSLSQPVAGCSRQWTWGE